MTYYLWEENYNISINYNTRIYCDGEFSTGFHSVTAAAIVEQWGSVDWPAEKVWCNKEYDNFDGDFVRGSDTVWNVEKDYNTKYCGGTASKVTVEVEYDEAEECRY